MTTIIYGQKALTTYPVTNSHASAISRFIAWATGQDAVYHLAWAGVSLVTMAAVFFPLTMAIIMLNGPSFPLIITAMISLALVFILNLAALPTRFTIPAFMLAVAIDVFAITASFFIR